jgi:hypothetical protein
MSGNIYVTEASDKEYRVIQALAQKVRESRGTELTLEEIQAAMKALRETPSEGKWVN